MKATTEEDVILCSDFETFKLKQVLSTNPLLIIEKQEGDSHMDDSDALSSSHSSVGNLKSQATFYLEAVKATPSIDTFLHKLKENTFDGKDIEAEEEMVILSLSWYL